MYINRDSAGQERFRTLTSAYYRGAHAVLIVYDSSRYDTFESVREWLKEFDIFTTSVYTLAAIIANKLDLDSKVDIEEAKQFVQQHDLHLYQTSAKTGTNIDMVFETVTTKIIKGGVYDKMEKERNRGRIVAMKPNKDPGCCGKL